MLSALVTVAVVATALVAAPARPPADSSATEVRRVDALPVSETVSTTSGPVLGGTDGRVRTWLGLPYAAPPTGDRRWRPPAPPRSWDAVRPARSYGDACVQAEPYEFGQPDLTRRKGSSEDCLYLNVSRPDDARPRLPVVVWLHGGGFFAGSGASATAVSSALVERGIVLVTVNYRLGRLGYFAHPALRQPVANFGLLDQVAALRWVRANAAVFGGDPQNVTVAGSSAGAMSVNALMSAPVARGLFDRAISQSAPSDVRSRTIGEMRRIEADALPADSVDELRALPADDLLLSTFNTLAGDAPILDTVLPESSAAVFARGGEHRVPYLVGNTSEEFSDADYESFGVDPESLRASLGGARHDDVVAAYGERDYVEHVLDDLVFQLPNVDRAAAHSALAPTFRYVFAGTDATAHGTEVSYTFDDVRGGADGRLADAVADYWVAFARTGRPQVPGLATWPRATRQQPSAYLDLVTDGPTPHESDDRVGRMTTLRDSLDVRP